MGELLEDVEHPELAPVMGAVLDEVVSPDMAPGPRACQGAVIGCRGIGGSGRKESRLFSETKLANE
jgi:hypothetical protein